MLKCYAEAFRGATALAGGSPSTARTVAQRVSQNAPATRGRPTTQASYYRQLFNRRMVIRPRVRGR